jgi:hypothetical protein
MATPNTPVRRSDNSANVALLQEVWRQAYQMSEPLSLDFGSAGEANSMRTKLYNAVRNVKNFPEDYPDLVEAVNNLEIVKDDLQVGALILRRKELSPAMVKLRQVLASKGVKVEDASLQGTAKSRELNASMDRLLSQLSDASEPQPVDIPAPTTQRPAGHNPFFNREQQ